MYSPYYSIIGILLKGARELETFKVLKAICLARRFSFRYSST